MGQPVDVKPRFEEAMGLQAGSSRGLRAAAGAGSNMAET
jgi:hypothetical protein